MVNTTNCLSGLWEEQTLGGTPFHKTNPVKEQYLLHMSLKKKKPPQAYTVLPNLYSINSSPHMSAVSQTQHYWHFGSDILLTFFVMRYPVCCRMFSNIPGLCPLGVSSIPLSWQSTFPDIVLWRANSVQAENHSTRDVLPAQAGSVPRASPWTQPKSAGPRDRSQSPQPGAPLGRSSNSPVGWWGGRRLFLWFRYSAVSKNLHYLIYLISVIFRLPEDKSLSISV